jgi:HPt (histidine-containing phosphotransfer) domain-containing protein
MVEAKSAPLVDPVSLVNATGGSVSLAVDIIRVCLEFIPTGLAEIQAAIASGQADRVRSAAHKMAGCVITFSSGPAYVAARRLETLGKAGELAGIDYVFHELEEGLEELHAALDDLTLNLSPKTSS